MGMTNGRTICSKHDEIKMLSERLSNLLSGQDSIDSFSDIEAGTLESTIEDCEVLQKYLNLLKEDVDEIFTLADYAKVDGQSMESGLDTKRTEIDSLRSQILDQSIEIRELEESLETATFRISYLESLLENNHA